MKLILHTGFPKCGSSTIQALLLGNRAALERRGVFLVGADFLAPGETSAWDWPVWFLEKDDTSLGARLAARREDFARLGATTMVLSAENLSDPARLANLEAAFQAFETYAVCYVRRQDEFLLSAWRQWGMKRGVSIHRHILRRVAEGRPDYRGTLTYLRDKLGADRVHAAFLDTNFLAGGTLEADFWSAAGLGDPPAALPPRANISPDRAILLFLSGRPELFKDQHDDAVVSALANADDQPPRRLFVDRHVQRSLKQLYDPVNLALARDFMGRADGDAVLKLDAPDGPDPFVLSAQDHARLSRIIANVADAALRQKLAAYHGEMVKA